MPEINSKKRGRGWKGKTIQLFLCLKRGRIFGLIICFFCCDLHSWTKSLSLGGGCSSHGNSSPGRKTWAKSHFWRLCFPLIDLNTFLSEVRKYTGNKWMYLPVYISWLFSALTGVGQLKAVCREAGAVSGQILEDEQESFPLSYLSPSLDLYFTLQIEKTTNKQRTKTNPQKTPNKPQGLKPIL